MRSAGGCAVLSCAAALTGGAAFAPPQQPVARPEVTRPCDHRVASRALTDRAAVPSCQCRTRKRLPTLNGSSSSISEGDLITIR